MFKASKSAALHEPHSQRTKGEKRHKPVSYPSHLLVSKMQASQMLYEQQLSQLQIHDHSHYSTLHHLLNAYISLVADLQNASYPTYMHRAPTLCSSILLPINQKNKDYSISNEYKIKISVCLKIMVKQKALIFNNQYAHFFFFVLKLQ